MDKITPRIKLMVAGPALVGVDVVVLENYWAVQASTHT